MFKLRSGGQGGSGPVQTPSIEAIRRQARQRLIGASILVLMGIIGLPWLFDTQPRPVPVDIAIDIPAKDQAPPLAAAPASPRPPDVAVAKEREEVLPPRAASSPPPPPEPASPPAAAPAAPAAAPVAPPAQSASTTVASASKVPVAPPPPAAPPAPAAPARVAAAPVPATPAPAPEAARAQALLEGRTPPPSVRVVVQVGAFAEQARAQEVRNRLERAGLKTYTQVAQTAEGPRIRVRLGPFDSRTEAEQAADKVRQLGLPASILTL